MQEKNKAIEKLGSDYFSFSYILKKTKASCSYFTANLW